MPARRWFLAGIVWLASYPKSGNTWMRAFLANYIENPDSPLRINDLPRYSFGDSQIKHFESVAGTAYGELSPEERAQARGRVQAWFARGRREDVFVKTHNLLGRIKGVPLISPRVTVGAVYLVRNPLDVAVSFAHHFQISTDRAVELICDHRTVLPASESTTEQYIGSWSRNARTWFNGKGMMLHVARYEDMVQRPLKTFGAVVRFLDMPIDRPRLTKALRFASFEELRAQESMERFVEGHEDGRKFFREGRVGAWRERLTDAQRGRLVEAHRAMMRQLGYLNEKDQPIGI